MIAQQVGKGNERCKVFVKANYVITAGWLTIFFVFIGLHGWDELDKDEACAL